MQLPDDWRRYVAPAAFLLAVTIAVVAIRSGLESGGGSPAATPTVTTTQRPVLSQSSSRTTKTSTSTKQFWTVKAGDTFGVIATQTGVPVTTIEQLNPTVKSTSLFIGEKIRIK